MVEAYSGGNNTTLHVAKKTRPYQHSQRNPKALFSLSLVRRTFGAL